MNVADMKMWAGVSRCAWELYSGHEREMEELSGDRYWEMLTCPSSAQDGPSCILSSSVSLSRVWLTRFEQHWNEDESSSVHRETVAFTMRVKPGLLEKQQRQRRQQQSCVNTSGDKVQLKKRKAPSKGQNLDYDSWMIYVKQILFETIIFKYANFDTMTDVIVKKREQN